MSTYQPAACNISRRGRVRRLAVAVVAFAVAVAYVGAVAVDLLPEPLLVGAFVPLAVGFEWGFQAATSFCVRLALANRYDFRPDGGAAGAVTDPDHRRADHEYAAKLTVAACALAGASTVLVWVLL
ncbi:MAG: hypothetical protein ABEI39_03225 [Halobacteriales archaeon]